MTLPDKFSPDTVGRCARRLAAKMVADQAVRCMLTMVSIDNTGEGPHADVARYIDSDDLTIVLVATGKDARRVLAFMEKATGGRGTFEAVTDEERGPTP